MTNTLLVIFGKKGSGKTTLVKEIIRSYDRVLILDLMAEYGHDVRAEIIEGDLATCVLAVAALESRPRFRVSVRTLDVDDNLAVLWCAKELPNTLLVIEEASLLCSPYNLPESVAWIVRYGRHRGLDPVFVARRPSELNRDVTANADVIASFRQTEPIDLEYLRATMGPKGNDARELADWKLVAHGDMSKAPLCLIAREEVIGSRDRVTRFDLAPPEPETKDLTPQSDTP